MPPSRRESLRADVEPYIEVGRRCRLLSDVVEAFSMLKLCDVASDGVGNNDLWPCRWEPKLRPPIVLLRDNLFDPPSEQNKPPTLRVFRSPRSRVAEYDLRPKTEDMLSSDADSFTSRLLTSMSSALLARSSSLCSTFVRSQSSAVDDATLPICNCLRPKCSLNVWPRSSSSSPSRRFDDSLTLLLLLRLPRFETLPEKL